MDCALILVDQSCDGAPALPLTLNPGRGVVGALF